MAYSQLTPIVGQVQQGYFYVPDTIQREILGTVIPGVDNYYGFGEFMYVQVPASTPITQGQVVYIGGFGGAAGSSAFVAPTNANTGRSFGVAINAFASVAAIQYGWVQISGAAVVKATASLAAGSTYGLDITVAGSVAAASAGRQVLNSVVLAPSTFAVTKAAVLVNGQPFITVPNVDGIVVGFTVSGTGVSGTVIAIDPNSRLVTLSANSTAGGNSSVTFTATGFIVSQLNRSFVQGQIT